MKPLNAFELTAWLSAFTANQPQPTKTDNAAYWACAAVKVLRGEGIPTQAEANAMLQWVIEKIRGDVAVVRYVPGNLLPWDHETTEPWKATFPAACLGGICCNCHKNHSNNYCCEHSFDGYVRGLRFIQQSRELQEQDCTR